MNAIGSRLDPKVYGRSVPPAIFRRRVLLGAEFLNGIQRQLGDPLPPLLAPLMRTLLVARSN